MTAICATPFKLPACRVTLLDSCGVPQTTATSMITTTGIIQVQQTNNYEDREEFFVKNGDGQFCVTASNAPILKYMELEIQLCLYDPEQINIMTAEPLVLDDTTTTPNSIGFRSQVGTASLNNFAFEGWTRLTNKTNCSTGPQYGYVLYPYCIEGTVDDVTWGNSNIVMTIKARTTGNAGWGTGPYNIDTSKASTLTTGQPQGLLTPILASQHRHWQLTSLAPPQGACGGQPSTLTLPTITKVALVATLTFPSPNAHLPAIINWGDGTADTTVTTGTSTTHTYAGNGTYNVTYNPTTEGSGPPWKGTVTLP